MPIQFPQFDRISYDEANPMFKGVEQGQQMMQNFMQFPQDLRAKILANQIAQVQAQYAEPTAKGNLTKLNQENQWNPKIWQSEIGLRGAQTGLAGEQAKWLGPTSQSEINLRGAQTKNSGTESQMNQLKLDYLKSMLGGKGTTGGAGVGGNPGAGTVSSPSDVGYPNQTTGQMPGNSVYGIPTPAPSQSDIANKMLLGMDTFSSKLKNAKAQQQNQYTQYQKSIGDAIQQAGSAQKAKQILAMFNNVMDKSFYKGPTLGVLPSSGIGTAMTYAAGQMVPGVPTNLSSEQIADYQVSNLMPGAITELREAMGAGQFSVADLNAASKMKVSRTMTDETRKNQSAWLNGIYDRFDEKAKFMSTLGNPSSGAQKVDADMLWQNYQKDFPLIDKGGEKYQGENLGNWPLYTTPRAIASVQSTGTYTPSKAEKNTFMMKYPDGRILPVKKGRVESAFRKGARPL